MSVWQVTQFATLLTALVTVSTVILLAVLTLAGAREPKGSSQVPGSVAL